MPASDMERNPSARPGLQARSYTNNPFLSPDTSDTWSTDDENGSSSGQDEFHLERYSQDEKGRNHHGMSTPGKGTKLGSRSRRRNRPDLNIVTELPGSQVRAVGDGLVVEQVKARKAATTRPKSVYSAKAEHVHDSLPPQRGNALAGLKQTAQLRHEKNRTQRETDESKQSQEPSVNKRAPAANTSRSRGRSDQKPVLIGISIPKEDADAHTNGINDTSAITLRTPSIVITPAAAGDAPWTTSQPTSKPRPISSIYSTAIPTHSHQRIQNAPPLPQRPTNFSNFSRPRTQSDPERNESTNNPRHSIDSWEEEEVQTVNDGNISRFSSESQERIISAETDPARPKSQGWWNLMLSPMLSRAGTQKSTTTRSPVPPVPPLPSSSIKRRSTMDSQISPETPRRLGLASARGSTWSRWGAWEKQKENPPLPEESIERLIRKSLAYQAPRAGPVVPIIIAPAKPTEGLAAEYYRACAIEQLTGEAYFDCENHSCLEKLPALHSIFDRNVVTNGHSSTRDVDAADATHQRTLSGSTNAISPEELSPNVRQADTVSLTKSRAVGLQTPNMKSRVVAMPEPHNTRSASVDGGDRTASPAPIPMPSPSKSQTRYPNIAAIVPPHHQVGGGATVASPGPISPEMQRTMTSQGAVPMSEMRNYHPDTARSRTPPTGFYNYVNYPSEERRDMTTNVYSQNIESKPSPRTIHMATQEEATREESKKEDARKEEAKKEEKEDKPSLFSRLKSLSKLRHLKSSSAATQPTKKRWVYLIAIALLLMVIGIVAAATQLTRHGDQTPTQQQWLNLTGYPPMPTGISTIIRPDLVQQQNQCVSPATLWSCTLPKENQADVAPNDPDQPNFRFEIKFRNGTVPSNMTIPISSTTSLSRRANDPFTNELFTPNPPPPSRAEQIFMGNTTDNITEPFDGEKTPFFMTFITAFPVDPNDPSINASTSDLQTRGELLEERQDQNLSSAIPPPDTLPDGSAAPANLLPADPFPFAQPIRLYNRGLQDEHYGFYMYYDKSIFLSSSTPLGDSNTTTNEKRQTDTDTDDTNGGSLRTSARARCTFSQTRFLVRIYTNPSFSATLLNGGVHSTAPLNGKTKPSSATNYTPPGSFPYPTTLTIDRHGGNINKKLAYCYGVDDLQVLQKDTKSVVVEERGVGGTLINAAPGLVNFDGDDNGEGFDESAGGIDGGTGGCGCSWQNWN